MGTEENKAVVRRFVDEVPNKKNSVPADELLTSGFVLRFPNMPAVEGIDAFKEIPTAILSAFPDLVETIDELVAEGDFVVERMTLRGTHLGEFMSVAPSGKPVSWTAIAIYRLEGDRIAECWVEPNLLGLAVQTGAASVTRGLLAPGDQAPRLD
jgi:predicted ester cyclase